MREKYSSGISRGGQESYSLKEEAMQEEDIA